MPPTAIYICLGNSHLSRKCSPMVILMGNKKVNIEMSHLINQGFLSSLHIFTSQQISLHAKKNLPRNQINKCKWHVLPLDSSETLPQKLYYWQWFLVGGREKGTLHWIQLCFPLTTVSYNAANQKFKKYSHLLTKHKYGKYRIHLKKSLFSIYFNYNRFKQIHFLN